MSLLGRMFGAPRQKASFSDHEAWFWDVLTGARSASGARVTAETALEVPTIYAAVKAVSEDIAKLPLVVLKVDGDRRERWRDNRLWPILHDMPWEGLTSYRFRQAMQAQVMLRGNAYAEIYRDGRGRVTGLEPLKAGTVTPLRHSDGTMFYEIRDDGRNERLSADRVFHLRGFGTMDYCGMPAVVKLRDSIGIALAAQDYAARFFANDATPRTVFKRPGRFAKDEDKKKFLDAVASMISGQNRHKPLLLEDGLDVDQLGMNNVDAQVVETRGLQRSEIAAAWRITPHKVGDLSRATFSNVEQMSIDYVKDTLMPAVRNWESELWLSLVPERERDQTEIKIVVEGELRGDTTSRSNYYKAALGATGAPGWMTPNEIRKLEDLNPHPDGDYLPVPSQAAASIDPAQPDNGDPNAQAPADQSPNDQPRGLRGDGAGRLGLRALPGARLIASHGGEGGGRFANP